MALLSEVDKDAIFKELESDLSNENFPISFGRPDGRLAIDNADQWIEDNFLSFHNSLPISVRTDLNNKWEIRLFNKIIKRKWEVE